MKIALTFTALLCVVSCNSILGVKDLSGGDESVDGGQDGGNGDSNFDDSSSSTATVRFLLVASNTFEIDPDGDVEILIPGRPNPLPITYGLLTTAVELPPGIDGIELRANDGITSLVVAVNYDRQPSSGETVTAVIAGRLGDTGAAGARVIGLNEADFDASVDPQIKLVNAIGDLVPGPEQMLYSVSLPGDARPDDVLGSFGNVVTPDPLAPSTAFRLRIGRTLNHLMPGTEEASFSVPAQTPSSKSIFVLGGNYRTGDQTRDPGLRLWMLQIGGGGTSLRADPAFVVVNFYADYAAQTIWIRDATDGTRYSANSTTRETPMRVFISPDNGKLLNVDGLPAPHSFQIPASPAGTRGFIALTGYISPSGGQPAGADVNITQLGDSSAASLTNVAFVHASPDPAAVDLSFINLEDSSTLPFVSNLQLNGASVRQVRTSPNAEWQVFPPGNTTRIARFTGAETFGERQIVVLSGTMTGSESLRVTDIDLRAWPWEVGSPVIGQ